MQAKYKKILLTLDNNVIIKNSIKESLKDTTLLQPDLILISDSTSKNPAEDIKNLRLLTYKFRPVIVALSTSSDLKNKLAILDAGSDDYIEEPVSKEEFKARINAHIRRVFESQTNIHTNLYNSKISYKTINRTINANNRWAIGLININYFEEYKSMYGDFAADKMLKTYAAIIKSTLDKNDYLGQLGDDDFLIITNPIYAEKIASYLVQAFDVIAKKFYNQQDIRQGYIIQNSNEIEEKPVPIVNTSIAIVSNEFKEYNNLKELMTDLLVLHKTARMRDGSNYLKDRPKITSKDTIIEKFYNNRIFIVEEDEALSFLLESNLLLRNYQVQKVPQLSEFTSDLIEEYAPALIIIDITEENRQMGLKLCKMLHKSDKNKPKILITTSLRNKQETFNAGIDLYIPKPYEIITLLDWAEKLSKEFNFNY